MKRWTLFLLLEIFLLPISFSKWVLSPELMMRMKRMSEPSVSPDGKTILFVLETIDIEKNRGYKNIFSISSEGGPIFQLTHQIGNAISPHWLKDGKRFTYLSNETGVFQCFEMHLDGSEKKQITQFETGISSFKLGENGKQTVILADIKTGEDIHDRYTDVPKSEAKLMDATFYRFWDQWDDYNSSHLFTSIDNQFDQLAQSKDIQTSEPYDAEGFDVSNDGNYIAYSCKKLIGNEFAQSTNNDIYLYDILNKTTTNLSLGMEGYDLNPKFNQDGTKLCWTSMPNNGNEADISNLMCYDLVSKKVTYLIKDLGENIDAFDWSLDGNFIYFLKEKEGTIQLHSYACSTNKMEQLTHGLQDFTSLAIVGNYAILLKTSFTLPDELVKVNLHTGVETQLSYVNKEILDNLKFGKEEMCWINTSDQKRLQTWVFYPPDFDSTKKYPTILYCQGGPQVGITQAFSYRWNLQLMCAKGYIVVAPNRRGVPGFGKEWKDQISEDWGGQSIQDYLSAIDSISKRSYVDTKRIGAVGASYGAYSVYWLEGHNENHRFKTFIAHCGVFNLESWYSTTDQTFFGNHEMGGNYWENPTPKSFAAFSPHRFLKNWETPILVIHNEKDFRVPVSEGMQAFGAAQIKNIKSRFLYFPDEGHWVLKPQNSLVWHREFYRWLEETL